MQIFKKIKKYHFNVHVCHIKGSDPAGFLKDEAQALIADGRQLAVLPPCSFSRGSYATDTDAEGKLN